LPWLAMIPNAGLGSWVWSWRLDVGEVRSLLLEVMEWGEVKDVSCILTSRNSLYEVMLRIKT
jgi:hypothetical protein